MTPEEWRKVKEVLQTALELDPHSRKQFLDSACAGKDFMRSEVESLLESHERDQAFLEQPIAIDVADFASSSTRPATWTGRRLGPYVLLDEIGEGGMGAVYRAARVDGLYEKQVAIKLIRGGLRSDFFVSRFRNERQILAGLEHPNIARLLDGGVTDEGLPYVVLEFIAGVPIDEYCVRHNLSITDRLELFRAVCSAVQYAHQNLVVHRDLKPGNILVTEDGIPKLLDFGIAKIVDPQQGEPGVDHTLTVMRIMTPDFASPEQVRGDPITTSSDIYSLGVILYLLLTGRRPYRVSSVAPRKILEAICDTDPERPSVAVTRLERGEGSKEDSSAEVAERTDSDPKREKLRRALSGDLDNIALKALRKEPERRYATVEQFSEDIRRHLGHLPVIARKDTPSYRTTKFIQRHKAGVAAAAGVALALVAALLVTIHEAHLARGERMRAERRFNDVRQLATSLMSEIHDSVATVPGTTAARRLIAQRSLGYLDSLAREAGSDSTLQGELAAAYVKVGDVQGQSYYANLGDTAGALASYRKALAIRETLVAAAPGDIANRLELTRCLSKVGEIQAKMGDQSGADASYQRAISLAESLAAQDPASRETQNELYLAHTRMGYLREDMGDKTAALASHRAALLATQRLIEAHPSDPLACHDLATAYNNVGDLLAKTGNVREGLETYRKGLAVCEWASADDPQSTPANTRGWLDDYTKMGEMLTQLGNRKEAFENYEKAMSIARRLSAVDPQNAQAAADLSNCYQSFGDSQLAFGELVAALETYRQAVTIREQLSARDEENAEARANLASSYAKLGQAYIAFASKPGAPLAARTERWREARRWLQKSLNLWTTMNQNGTLPGNKATEQDEVTKQIARCDAALGEAYGSR